jgi:MSHA biogenesis protein MshI
MLFNRQTHSGWMAVALRPAQVELAHVQPGTNGARPRLAVLEAVARERGTEADAIARVRRPHALQNYRCATVLDAASYQFVQLNSPSVAPEEMKQALRWAVKDSLEFPADDAVIDALQVPSDGAPLGRPPLTFAIAARKEKVADKVRAFQRAKVKLRVIDVTETAQRNLAALFEQPGRGLALLVFHEAGGLLTFTRDGELFASRRIDIPASALALTDDNDAARRDALFERVGLEVQRSLDNFDRQFSQIALQRLLVAAPSGASVLLSYLASNLYLPVEAMNLADVMDLDAFPALKDPTGQTQWLEAIGLSLRDED